MTIRRLRNKTSLNNSNTSKSENISSEQKRGKLRRHLLETLEARQLLAAGPQLIGVQPNNSDLIENGIIRNIAPRELTFRFDDSQIIDAATTSGIRVSRAGSDGSFSLPSNSTDFGSSGRVDVQLTSRNAADLLTINVVRQDLGPASDPRFSFAGSVLTITLNSNAGGLVTAQKLVDLINTSPITSPRLSAKVNGGLVDTKLGGSAVNLSPLRLISNNDVVIQPGAVVIGDRPNENEVTLRFAENLPDDHYRLEVFGFDDLGRGIRGLRNTSGDLFVPSNPNTRQETIDFRLDLGSKISAVVPQPVVRNATGGLEQQRNTIVVYFDNDKLLVENGPDGKPTARSVENPSFYQLIYTADTVRNTDDLPPFFPVSVQYNASANTATLKFDNDIDALPGPFLPSSTFRLRIGTRETAPLAPVRSEASATAITDLNTNGAAKIRFTSKVLGESGSGAKINFVNVVPSAQPTVSVVGNTITVDLGGPNTTVAQVVLAIESDPASSALVKTVLEPGSNGATIIGNKVINYSPVTLYGLGSSFDTAANLGTIGSSNVPLTSLLLTSSIDPESHVLDLLGAADDPAQRIVAEPMENHINPAFGGDSFQGIRTLYYNFKSNYGTDNGVPLSNAITDKQKDRIREAFSLWSNYLGVQFIESESSGLTMAFGITTALNSSPGQVENNGTWGVRIDPSYQNSLAVFAASNPWNDNYGENVTRTATAAIGYLLGLSRAGNLDPSQLMSLDAGFLNFPASADRNFEPVFPGNQDILQGQYLHRPEGSDIDLYRFDIDFGPNGQSRTGELVAETFAERSLNSSPLDTRLALYKEVLATAHSNLGAGQGVDVLFTAVRPGKLGNNLQIFVTRSNRGTGALPIVNVFPNAITIDLNSTQDHESTLAELLTALDNDPAARALVKVTLISGSPSTVIGNRDITYSPITLKGGEMKLMSQNDNYFSKDSLMRMSLDSGVYYIGVSASGNDQYDATVPGTGTGGKTEGKYDLRITFRAQTDSVDAIGDVISGGDMSMSLDGDSDGVAGGVNNFWFQTRPLDRALRFNAGGSASLEGKTVTITGANGIVRVFEFSADNTVGIGNTRVTYTLNSTSGDLAIALANAINSRSELGVTATSNGARIILKGERTVALMTGLTVIDLSGKTIFVDKAAGPNADGSLARPFNTIAAAGVPNAFASAVQGDIIRIVGNGGNDGKLETVGDNVAYEVGFGALAGTTLADGSTMDVPKGVTVMVDAGAVFKMNRSRIGVGSTSLSVDRSGGALQVFGAPILLDSSGNPAKLADGTVAPGSVYFTSWFDESIGLDNYQPKTDPSTGDWGGLVFKRDLDAAAGRFDLEDEGIFRQYVNHADIRYGGSTAVVIDSTQQTVNSIQIADMRPTLTFNKITFGSDSAITATPDSFEETLFSEPIYQRKGSFTPDYDRVGPEIHDNLLVNNSINGIFIKVSTPAAGALKELTVPGRFDDIDITHVIAENIIIQGRPGGGLLDQTVLPSNLISLKGRTGGTLIQGTYNYKITYVDKNGYETPASGATQSVSLVPGQTAISVFGLPSVNGEFVNRRLYRSNESGEGPYRLVAELDGGSIGYEDLGAVLTDTSDDKATLFRDAPNVSGVISQPSAGGSLIPGSYTYRVVMVDEAGRESIASAPTSVVTIGLPNRSVRLTNLPLTQQGYALRRVYRSSSTGAGTYQLVAEITDSAVTSILDNGTNLNRVLSVASLGTVRPRLDASLVIDPGTIVKLEGARIEIGHSAQLMAEGVDGVRVVFTSKQDDRFGIGGTFDTNNNGLNGVRDANPRDWSGIYASPGSNLLLDHVEFAYAGGSSRIEGTFKAFSPIELQQANSRIAHSTFENNANGMGGQGPIDRLGRPANENYPLGNNASRGSTLFIRGTQPTLLGNIFQNNEGSAITIDANSMDAVIRGDSGRQSGFVDRSKSFDSNQGPLIRENRFFNNGINGLEVRADASTNNRDENVLAVRDLQQNVLTTESVWDDTDIVHVLFDSITVSNLEHSGGLRLQSAINQSLVVKMEGQGSNFDKERGTGFTATGRLNGVADRVGGTIQVVGQPGFPVVFTSLRDDSVGAGTQPDGRPQTDTNNDGIASIPRPGDWRSLVFDTFSNDRNVITVMEVEPPDTVAPGTNDAVLTAQLLGKLAANESSTDENLPLGFVVHGVLSEANDQDIYSMVATAGTEVWFDIDSTTYALDSVIEVLDANGNLLARSDNSTDEQAGTAQILTTPLLDANNANPLVRKPAAVARKNASGLLKDDYTSNPRDAGIRLLLPGISGTITPYFFRIRSQSTNTENSAAGLTSGNYTVQVRLRDAQEFAGSVVQFADIRYATNGVHATGLPYHSPLTGEADTGMYDGTDDGITQLGSLHLTDRGAISVAGTLSGITPNLMQFTLGQSNVLRPSFLTTYPISIDVDYADGLQRPDTSSYLFTNQGLLVGRDSSITDDRPGPLRGSDQDDLSRGSVGAKDPFLGTLSLPAGTYDLAVAGPGSQPIALARNTVLFDDSFETLPYRGIRTPILSNFIDEALLVSSYATDPFYYWKHMNTSEGGHGGTAVVGWDPNDPSKNTFGASRLLSSTFALPTTWERTDPIHFSMNFRFPQQNEPMRLAIYDNALGAGAPIFDTPIASNNSLWNNLSLDLSSVIIDPTVTYVMAIEFIDAVSGLPTIGSQGLLLDDFYLGIWTPRYSPIDSYRYIANDSLEGVPDPTASLPVLFDPLNASQGWNVSNVGIDPARNHLGPSALAFRPAAGGAVGEIVSNTMDLRNELGTWGYFTYDFNPHDNNESFEAFVRIPGRPDTLVASSNPTAGSGVVVLARSQGQWEQARFDMRAFEGQTAQLVFKYNSQGANPAGSGARGYAFVDDIKIGLRSRGERVVNTTLSKGFINTTPTSGDYQVEIRKSDSTSSVRERYDRGSESTSLLFSAGLVIPDKSVMELSDGANRIRFQFTYDGTFEFGNSPISITGTMTRWELARAVRDAINTQFVQNRIRISAANSNGVDTGPAGENFLLHLDGDVTFVSGADLFGPNGVINFNGFGDKNIHRDQGQFMVLGNKITDSRDYAVWSGPADLYYVDGKAGNPNYTVSAPTYISNYQIPPTFGGAYARKLPVLNKVPFAVGAGSVAERAGATPGMIVSNNIFDSSGLGGLHVEGENPFWRITAFPGVADLDPTKNADGDHSGGGLDDGDVLRVDYGRQRVNFEFEDIAGGTTNNPTRGSAVVGGNGWNPNNIPIYYRDDTGSQYLRAPNTSPGYSAREVISGIRDSILGSVLVTNATTQVVHTWFEDQVFAIPDPTNPILPDPTASMVIQGPQDIQYFGTGGSLLTIQRLGNYTAAPFLRAVNNTIVGNDGRASFNPEVVDSAVNNTIEGAAETWQGKGTNSPAYVVSGTITPDPLSNGSSDVDIYKFYMEVGDRVLIDVDTLPNGRLDSALKLFDSQGRAQIVAVGNDPTTSENQIAPGETAGLDSYIDFTATSAGTYYAAVSSTGNSTYDPLSLADRLRGNTSGDYSLSIKVLKPESYVITVDDPASYASGSTFTIDQVADFAGTTNRTRTFEFTRTGQVQPGNVPIYIGPEYRVPDMARAIAGAINAAGMLNTQTLENGAFGGTTLLKLPLNGGAGLLDDTLFSITNNARTVVFEFDSNNSGPSTPGNVVVPFTQSSSVTDLVNLLIPLIQNANLGIVPQDVGAGRISLGAIPSSAVKNVNSAITTVQSASPLAPVSAIALGGINGYDPTANLPAISHGDVGINSGNIRGAELQAGLNRYRGSFNLGDEQLPFVVATIAQNNGATSSSSQFNGHLHQGFGHDRTMSLPFLTSAQDIPITALGNGTTEKYVVIRNASRMSSVGGTVKIDPDLGSNKSMNQIIPESGIMVSGGGTPTLLNNVFVNVQTPVVREFTAGGRTVRPSAVILGGSIYQYTESQQAFAYLGLPVEASPTNVANTALDFNFVAGNSERLFVDAQGGNFLPNPNSRVIDSSIDSLSEREGLKSVKGAVGIAPSPVLAPDRDNSGQLRADDPNIAPPSGLGGNVFKDRGALDRADFIGPTAVSLNPIDNDAQSVDIDTTASVMRLSSGVYPEFRIQLKDGFETSNLQAGTGINDDSVTGREGSNRLPGSVVTITENGRLLVEGIDYAFSYNTTTNEIVLKPLAGVWKNSKVYDITLNNKDRFVINAPAGDQVSDGNVFTIQDSLNGKVTFEYDSGYRLQIPQGIELLVPLAGGGAGGVNDGDTFVVNNGSQSFTFEFDNNNNSIPGTITIPFTSLSTRRDLADAMIAALSTVPNIVPKIEGTDNVFIGAPLGAYADTTDAIALSQPKSTLALLVPALGTRPGGVVDGQTFGVSDGRQNLIFEFDSDRIIQTGSIRIDISSASTAAEVAAAIKSVLDTSGLAISTMLVGNTKIHLGLPNSGRIDTLNSTLRTIGVSRALIDGQSISITRTVGNVVTTKVFEIDTDNSVGNGNVPVAVGISDTQSNIGQKLADAIKNSGLALTPEHVGDGNIFIGGSAEYAISTANAASIGLFGRPGVQGNTTLQIFGSLLLQLPSRGGVDLTDNSRFTITNNSRTVTFEFDGNFSGPSTPGFIAIPYTQSSTAADLVTTMLPLITNANLGLTPRDVGAGQIDLGLLPDSAVNTLSSAVTTVRGNVLDGDHFTINNGTRSVTFEFENLSIGNGRDPSKTPIRYNNQSSRNDVFLAMKAAIESSLLGLQTVVQTDGLRLLDNARFTTNVDNAPSLRMTGVPGGAIAINFVQDASFSEIEMRDSIIKSINDANRAGRTSLTSKVRGGSTLFVENAVNLSPTVTSYYLRGIEDIQGNFLKSNRINNETQFTVLMPGVLLDFGDAPDPVTTTSGRYPTSLAFDGARHVSNATPLRFGSQISSELDGIPTPKADGDGASDDGIDFKFQNLNKPLFNRNVDTTVTITVSQPGIVDGWIDFNADGDWTDPGENVLNGAVFTANTLTQEFKIRVPVTAPVPTVSTDSYARFRTSTAGNTLPTGLALDGEVQDYLVRIVPGIPPVGRTDLYTMDEDQVGGLTANDPDGAKTPGFTVDDGVLVNDQNPDGRKLLAKIVTPPQHTVSNSFVFGSDGTFTYIPSPNYFGTDTFVYQTYVNLDQTENEILESLGFTTVTITIRPVNDVPTANSFSRSTDEDVPLSLTEAEIILLGQALAGPPNESAQVLRVSLPNNVSAQGGTVNLVNGSVVYKPQADFSGVDTFTYTLTDNGITGILPDPLTVTRTITVTVRDKNDDPITTPKSFTIGEDGSDSRGPAFYIAGDTAGPAPELNAGQTITFTGVEPDSEKGGSVTFVNGQVIYRPAADFNGVDRFFYLVTDNGTSQGIPDPKTSRGTVTVTVTAVDDIPRVVAPLGTVTMLEDEAERALPFANFFFDPDVIPNDDKLTYSVVSNSNPSLVDPTFGANDIFVRPKADQNGTATIVFQASDRAGNTVRNTLTLNVTPVNDSPRLNAPLPNRNVLEDAQIQDIELTPGFFFDPDVVNGDTLNFSVTNSNSDVVTASIVNGKLRLVLVPDASGVSTITVRAVDSTNNVIEDSFDITVAPVNDAPRVVDDLIYLAPQGVEFKTTDARGTVTTSKFDDGVLANDRDIEGNNFTARLTQQPTLGRVTLNPDGTFTYVPNPSTLKGQVDSFRYEAVDSLGAVSLPGVVQITITNPPPPRHQNPIQKLDVDADGFISPIDVLAIINFINFNGVSTSVVGLADPPPYRDVNGNNVIEPLDALEVINYINDKKNGGAGEGEGEAPLSGGVGVDLSAPMTWCTDVMRESVNLATTMRPVVGANLIGIPPANAAQPLSRNADEMVQRVFGNYLASFENESEEESDYVESLISTQRDKDDNESLDSFFAEVFGQ